MDYYIAVFVPAPEGGYSIFFPDIPEAFTQGDSLEEGMKMAADVLAITVEEYTKARRDLPRPSGQESAKAWAEKEKARGDSGLGDFLFQLFAAPEMDSPR